MVVPLTRTQRNIRWHVSVRPPEGGSAAESFIRERTVRFEADTQTAPRAGLTGNAGADRGSPSDFVGTMICRG